MMASVTSFVFSSFVSCMDAALLGVKSAHLPREHQFVPVSHVFLLPFGVLLMERLEIKSKVEKFQQVNFDFYWNEIGQPGSERAF